MPVNNVGDGVVSYAPTRNPFNYDKFEQVSRDLATNWLTLDEITQQINLYGDESQDELLEQFDLQVRMYVEDYLGVPIFPITYRVYYGASALYGSPLTLDLPEVSQNGVTINSVKYYNLSNVLTTVATNTYYYDASGNKVVLSDLPTDLNADRTSPVVCEYTVAASILAQYPVIKGAAKLLLTHFYNNRSNTTTETLNTIPLGVDVLLRPYKNLVM